MKGHLLQNPVGHRVDQVGVLASTNEGFVTKCILALIGWLEKGRFFKVLLHAQSCISIRCL